TGRVGVEGRSGRGNRHAPGGAEKSSRDAGQGGQGLQRRPFPRKNSTDALQRSLVSRNTAASDFMINDLVNHEAPISLYLVVPPSDKIRLRPLIRLIFTMIVNRLTKRMDFEGPSQKKNRNRLLFMIDAFPTLHPTHTYP